MTKLSFNVLDDLNQSLKVLSDFIAQKDTKEVIEKAISIMADSIKNGGKIMSAGNGGSMCDAMHFAEELTGRYRDNRPSYPAIAIADPSHLTCVGNDYGFDYVFSRFLEGMGFTSIVLLGKDGGKLKDLCDLPIIVPHVGYADRIQEVHTMIIHIMIRGIEELLKQFQSSSFSKAFFINYLQ